MGNWRCTTTETTSLETTLPSCMSPAAAPVAYYCVGTTVHTSSPVSGQLDPDPPSAITRLLFRCSGIRACYYASGDGSRTRAFRVCRTIPERTRVAEARSKKLGRRQSNEICGGYVSVGCRRVAQRTSTKSSKSQTHSGRPKNGERRTDNGRWQQGLSMARGVGSCQAGPSFVGFLAFNFSCIISLPSQLEGASSTPVIDRATDFDPGKETNFHPNNSTVWNPSSDGTPSVNGSNRQVLHARVTRRNAGGEFVPRSVVCFALLQSPLH